MRGFIIIHQYKYSKTKVEKLFILKNLQNSILKHLVQVVDASGGFLRDTFDTLQELRVCSVNEVCQITTVIEDHVQGLAISKVDGLVNTPVVLFVSLTLPCIHGDTSCSNGSSSEILLKWQILKG